MKVVYDHEHACVPRTRSSNTFFPICPHLRCFLFFALISYFRLQRLRLWPWTEWPRTASWTTICWSTWPLPPWMTLTSSSWPSAWPQRPQSRRKMRLGIGTWFLLKSAENYRGSGFRRRSRKRNRQQPKSGPTPHLIDSRCNIFTVRLNVLTLAFHLLVQ